MAIQITVTWVICAAGRLTNNKENITGPNFWPLVTLMWHHGPMSIVPYTSLQQATGQFFLFFSLVAIPNDYRKCTKTLKTVDKAVRTTKLLEMHSNDGNAGLIFNFGPPLLTEII